MKPSEEKIAKIFIEEELKFYFSMAETRRMANFILKGVEFGMDFFRKDYEAVKNRNRVLENLNKKYREQLGLPNTQMDLDDIM